MSDFDYNGLLPAPDAADDPRTPFERAILFYPITLEDFENAGEQGFFVPRMHHMIWSILLAAFFVVARRVFTK